MWPDKSEFEGNWVLGQRQGVGSGKLTRPDNSIYEGMLNEELNPHG